MLLGSARVVNGSLDVNGVGTVSAGWAVTGTTFGLYKGPQIVSKTMVVWLRLQSLGAWAGAALSVDQEPRNGVFLGNAPGGGRFDAIVFGEKETNRWLSGSEYFVRSPLPAPGFAESTSTLNTLIRIAVSQRSLGGGNVLITIYRNAAVIGNYTTGGVRVLWRFVGSRAF